MSKTVTPRHSTHEIPPLHALGWALGQGLWSRLIMAVAIFGVAPLLPVPTEGMAVLRDSSALARWDSKYYVQIATIGYEYLRDGQAHNVAFFPGLPGLMRLGMALGLTPEWAGICVNNLAFLGALFLLYGWMSQRYDRSVARWVTIALAWCPFSLFGSVLYTEGLFLLFTTAALWAYDRKSYGWAAVWGAGASATRLPGVMLVPAFAWVAWRERRGWAAYGSAAIAGLGTVLFSVFCGWRWGDFAAFLTVQKAWHPPGLAYGQGWLKSLVQVFLGPAAWRTGRVDLLYLVAVIVIATIGFWLWRQRQRLGEAVVQRGFWGLSLIAWALAGSPLINLAMVGGSLYLLWWFRRTLPSVAWVYALGSVAMILSTGRTISVERHLYGIVTVAIAAGLFLSQCPRWRWPVLSVFALLLVSLSIRFSQHLWAG